MWTAKDFLWGVATSSFQIEGATSTDGRGLCIWDTFCATHGKIADGTNGDVACDHYRLWEKDLDLLAWMGVKSYRFSIAWSRVMPTGRGPVNELGIAFYSMLVDGLIKRGIEPMITLYHWDLPQALEDEGGWRVRSTMDAFVDYVEIVSRHFGNRVKYWVTHNEPWCIAHLGHGTGEHAPGIKDIGISLQVAHHLLVSHGMAVPIIRANSPDAVVGITLNLCPAHCASNSVVDLEATRSFDGSFNRWYLDPIFGRDYPADKVVDYKRDKVLPEEGPHPFVEPGDMETISVETDFLGINYYSRAIIRDEKSTDNLPVTVHSTGVMTEMGWEVVPDALEKLLIDLRDNYSPKSIIITENGAAYGTAPDKNGVIDDAERQNYFRGHIAAVGRARDAGVPVDGYFAWSFLDNFEWAYGYEKRFGLVYVDYATQERLPKQSAHLYRSIIASAVSGEEVNS